MKLPERDAFYADFLALVGEVMDSQVIRGGDLSVHLISAEQQQTLLNVSSVAKRSVLWSLLIWNSNLKGLIFRRYMDLILDLKGVPIQDSVDEIKLALAEQHVSQAKRFPIKGRPHTLS